MFYKLSIKSFYHNSKPSKSNITSISIFVTIKVIFWLQHEETKKVKQRKPVVVDSIGSVVQ